MNLSFDHNLINGYLLCFIHIPKTAGTSFFAILQSLLGSDDVLELGWQTIFSEKKYDLNSYKAISGHFPYEIGKILPEDPIFLTFLRDPVERSLSQYVQSQNFPEHWAYERVRGMDIEQYIDNPDLANEITNVQTWMLGLKIDRPISSVLEMMNPRELSAQVIKEMSANQHNPVWTLGLYIGAAGQPLKEDNNIIRLSNDRVVSLTLAKERLEQFEFFGLTERFRDSVNLFAYTFGLPHINEVPIRRIASNRLKQSEIPGRLLDKIRHLNKMDIELYEYAKELFDTRYTDMLAELSEKYGKDAQSMTIETLLERDYWLNIQKKSGLQKSLKYDFTQTYPRSGWYPVERVNGKMWIWSGPETISTIDLPFDRADNLRVRFQVTHFIELDILESLEFCIDGQRIHLIHTIENGIHFFTGIIPANPEKQHVPTRLSFHVNRTVYPPGKTAESHGARLLGIALSWIEITTV